MGDITDIRRRPPEMPAEEVIAVWREQLDWMREGLTGPDYLTDDEYLIVFTAVTLASAKRLGEDEEGAGRRKPWDALCKAATEVLSFDSVEERDALYAEERSEIEAERRRASMRTGE